MISMKKGFTLMEILAVLLVIALVLSLAMPVLRTVRFEMRNSQAKAATRKLAEAVKTYYNVSRGSLVTGCFTPSTAAGKTIIQTAPSACNSLASTGIPNTGTAAATPIAQLFACGYLEYKDFVGLPYRFCPYAEASGLPALPSGLEVVDRKLATADGADAAKAGDKYKTSKGYMFVDASMRVKDSYD